MMQTIIIIHFACPFTDRQTQNISAASRGNEPVTEVNMHRDVHDEEHVPSVRIPSAKGLWGTLREI
jgi:hypothetical protein